MSEERIESALTKLYGLIRERDEYKAEAERLRNFLNLSETYAREYEARALSAERTLAALSQDGQP
jgi:hypothetical protein